MLGEVPKGKWSSDSDRKEGARREVGAVIGVERLQHGSDEEKLAVLDEATQADARKQALGGRRDKISPNTLRTLAMEGTKRQDPRHYPGPNHEASISACWKLQECCSHK